MPNTEKHERDNIAYNDIFMEDVKKLEKKAADAIISIEEILSKAEASLKTPPSRPAWAPPPQKWATRLIRAYAKQQQQPSITKA